MAEGMIKEFHRYLMERVIEEADDKAFAHESGDNKLYHFQDGRESMAKMILEEYEKRFSL